MTKKTGTLFPFQTANLRQGWEGSPGISLSYEIEPTLKKENQNPVYQKERGREGRQKELPAPAFEGWGDNGKRTPGKSGVRFHHCPSAGTHAHDCDAGRGFERTHAKMSHQSHQCTALCLFTSSKPTPGHLGTYKMSANRK